MNKSILKIVSFVLCFTMLLSVIVCRVFDFSVSASFVYPFFATVSSSKTSDGYMLNAFVCQKRSDPAEVTFYKATSFDVYGSYSTVGATDMNVKSNVAEKHLEGSDDNGYYITLRTSPAYDPYQAFDIDVSGVTGDIIFGYEGVSDSQFGRFSLQLYDPNAGTYSEVAEHEMSSGVISFVDVADAQTYSENNMIRYRVTFAGNDNVSKDIRTKYVTAGQVDKSVQFGDAQSRTTNGNITYLYTGETTDDLYFCAEAIAESGSAFSMIRRVVPDGYSQDALVHFNRNFYDDPKTKFNVTWSSTVYMTPHVQVIPYGHMYPDFSDAVDYSGFYEIHTDAVAKFSYFVTVDNLLPGHEYWYRYGDGSQNIWSTPCYMRTDDGDADFAFVVGGDPQPEASSHHDLPDSIRYDDTYKNVMRNFVSGVRLVNAEFVVNCGDETDAGQSEKCWNSYFSANSGMFRSIPMAVTMGNHDYRKTSGEWANPWWLRKHYFIDPTGKDPHGWFYSFDYGNAHIAVMNGNLNKTNAATDDINDLAEIFDREIKWLDQDLGNSDADFKIVVSHQGMYSYPVHTNDDETKELRPIIENLLDKHKVDLYLNGHDHVWIRTNQLKNNANYYRTNNRASKLFYEDDVKYYIDPTGTTYINSGSFTGGKYHDADPAKYDFGVAFLAFASQPNLPTFTTIEIHGGKLSLKGWALDTDGTVKRISEYSAYHSSGFETETDEYNIIVSSYYNKINNRINSLPAKEDILLSDYDEIMDLYSVCNKESDAVKQKFITAYSSLQEAVDIVEKLKEEGEKPGIPGDVDNNGKITIHDALMCLRASAELCVLNEKQSECADINGDGEITVTDAIAILRLCIGFVD